MMGLIVALAAIPIDYLASKAYGDGGNTNQIHVCSSINKRGRSVINFTGVTCNQATAISVHLGGSSTLHNTSVGKGALNSNATGSNNTAIGVNALVLNINGVGNTAVGNYALATSTNPTPPPPNTNPDANNYNTAIGYGAGYKLLLPGTVALTGAGTADTIGPTGHGGHPISNSTAIGAGAKVSFSDTMQFGNDQVSDAFFGSRSVGANLHANSYLMPSDKNKKENFQPVDGGEVLKKIRGLNLTSWNFIGQNPKVSRHYGPMAQEFYAAFGNDGIGTTVGTETTINTGDMTGILMIAVQELEKQKTAQAQQIKQLIADNAKLTEQISSQSKEIDYLKAHIVESKAENAAFKTRLDRIGKMMGIHDMTQAVSE
jgi:hypothetical protein